MHEIIATRRGAHDAELRCPCGERCELVDVLIQQDSLNLFLQTHRDHRLQID